MGGAYYRLISSNLRGESVQVCCSDFMVDVKFEMLMAGILSGITALV